MDNEGKLKEHYLLDHKEYNPYEKIEIINIFYYLYFNLNPMNRIKEVLIEKGIKQKWLSDRLGKSYNMVNAYVQNRQQPRLEVLYQIADILDVSVKDLIIDNSNSENK